MGFFFKKKISRVKKKADKPMGFETIGACRQTDTVVVLLLFVLGGDRESDLRDFRDVDASKAPPPCLSATRSVHRIGHLIILW